MEKDREEQIRAIAHRIWEEEGQPEGQEERHWRMAEYVIIQEEAERAGLVPKSRKEPPSDFDVGSAESSQRPRTLALSTRGPIQAARLYDYGSEA
jgi:Protein of unknown function (DUF2934)